MGLIGPFFADASRSDKSCFIEFECTMQPADIRINGKHNMQHAGRYFPFVIDISKYLVYGKSNRIPVRLDNRDNPPIPPGKFLEKPDFCQYGDIYRDVSLIVKNKIHITDAVFADEIAGGDVFVTYPFVSHTIARINVKAHLKQGSADDTTVRIKQRLYAIEGLFGERHAGKEAASVVPGAKMKAGESRHFTKSITVKEPRLWSPDAPYLYLLRSEVIAQDKVTDFAEQRIGIRMIKFTLENGFEISGHKLRLTGTNRHQEYPWNAVPIAVQHRDIYQIKTSGFNIVAKSATAKTTKTIIPGPWRTKYYLKYQNP